MAIAVTPDAVSIVVAESDRDYATVFFKDRKKPTEEELEAAAKWMPKEGYTEFLVVGMPEKMSIDFLNGITVEDIKDSEENAFRDGMGTRILRICKQCIRGWTDEHPLRNAAGESIPFSLKGGLLSDDALNRIAWGDKVSIAHKVMRGGRLDEEDVEKPEPSHTD